MQHQSILCMPRPLPYKYKKCIKRELDAAVKAWDTYIPTALYPYRIKVHENNTYDLIDQNGELFRSCVNADRL